MKTLWQKLSEVNRLKLVGYTSYNLVIVLTTEVAWTNLKVIEMMHLFEALEVKDFNFVTPLNDLFYA
jgi:hypothetical protein